MVAYACIGIMFLYTAVKATVYYKRHKNSPTSDDIDQHLLVILNREGDSQ